MTKMDREPLVLLFKVLANDVRLRLIEALASGEKSVGELSEETRQMQTRVSHELHCLTVCGVVNFRREGKQIIYSLNQRTVLPILQTAQKHAEKFAERMSGCEIISDARRMTVRALTV